MSSHPKPTQHVVVIGAGVVGLASAWSLLEAGFRVTVVERAQVAGGASYANGGQLSYRYVAPLADAGVPLKALSWMFQEDGPLRIKLEADWRQWAWLARFLGRCTAQANRRTTAKLLELGELSRAGMRELASIVAPEQYGWREAGKLVVYRSPALFAQAARKEGSGAAWSAAECVAREPALAAVGHLLAGGLYNDGEAVADCHAFCLALAERIRAHPRCAGIYQAEVTRIAVGGGRVTGLETAAGVIGGDAYVLAAGIESRNLAASLGLGLPLYPLKGYSLSAPIRRWDEAPRISVTDIERKVLYARIGDGLRVAAMVDLVGQDARPDPRRVASLVRQVRETMPRAADYTQLSAWAGLRPATPDGAPIIGASPLPNLWLNVGHGALGFTFAAGSARILADLMRGKAPPIALDMLGLRR